MLIIKALATRGVYWWVSPTYKVGTPAWRMITKKLVQLLGGNVQIKETTRVITLPNGSIIEFKSADSPQDLVSEGLSGLVLDECAKVKELAWIESLRPALTDKMGWVIFIGTPKGENWFYRLYLNAAKLEDWATFTFTSYDNPYIPASEIDSARETMPEITFMQEHLAKFTSGTGTIFKREWFNNRVESTDIIARFISWDTAQSVKDTASYSSCIVGELTSDYKLFIRHVYKERLEFPQLTKKVEEMAQIYHHKLKRIIVESKSSGLSVIQSIKQIATPEVARKLVPFIPKTDKVDRAYRASVWCENGSVILPPPTEAFPWLFDFEEELFNFPESEYKDMTDSFTQLILYCSNYLSQGLAAKQFRKNTKRERKYASNY